MKKANVFLVGILVCIAYYFYFSQYIQKENQRLEEEKGKLLLHLDPEEITGVSGTISGERIDMLKRGGVWRMAIPVVDDVDEKALKQVLEGAAAMTYESSFVPEDGNYANFELESPNHVWKFENAAGEVQELRIGDINVMGSKGYARIGDKPEVYLISLNDRNEMVKRPNDFREKKIFPKDIATLEKIEIKRGEETLLLTKKGGKWGLGDEGFAVNEELIRKIKEGLSALEVKGYIEEDLENRNSYLPEDPMAITFITPEAQLRLFVERAPGKASRYAVVEGKDRIVTLDGNYIENFEHEYDDFRQRRLFSSTTYQVTSLSLLREDASIELEERGNIWHFKDGIKAATAIVHDLINSLTGLEITDFQSPLQAGDVKPLATVTLAARNGEPEFAAIYEALMREKEYYVASADGKTFYRLKVEKPEYLFMSKADLRDKKIFSFDPHEINSIFVRLLGQEEVSLVRDGNVWKQKGEEKKSVVDFIWQLQDVSWREELSEIPPNLKASVEFDLKGSGQMVKAQLFTGGFFSVQGKKYKLSVEDVGKITDSLGKVVSEEQ